MDYKELSREKWFKENSPKSQLLSKNIIAMNPEIGFYITVDGIEISEDFFKEEYDQVTKSYFSVIKKLDEYYKNNIQGKNI